MNDNAFNNGLLYIYDASDISESGGMPVVNLTLIETLRYKERTVGFNRYFTNLQAQVKVKYLLRCPLRRNVSTQDIAKPNDGKYYKISQIQYPENIKPPVMDLTLIETLEVYKEKNDGD